MEKLLKQYRFFLITVFFIFTAPFLLLAQGVAPRRLVSAPTAGTLSSRTYFLETHLFDGGGVTQHFGIGITNFVDIGVAYSGSNIIGSRKVVWQPHVGAQIRIRIVEESMSTPAFAIGFDSQGEGAYIPGKKLNRFRVKSRGAYLVMSRNYRMLGDFGLHAGANYSLEDDDGDKDPSFWVGLDKSIGNRIEVCCEYDFATNDNKDNSITSNRGYLNSSVRLTLSGAFTLECDLQNILRNTKRDLTGHSQDKPEPSRELRIIYHARF
jgi:hypothetical protein